VAEYVVLLDADGNETGRMEKLTAHQGPGRLHRAFSVFLLDGDGRILLQRRAVTKHHFRDLWSNSCCSHPRPDESVTDAGVRRVAQELGIELAPGTLREVGSFVYRAEDPGSDLVEHEWDHVLVGRCTGRPEPVPDPDEVGDWRWVTRAALDGELTSTPEAFTPWLRPALEVLEGVGDDRW
jgi:isopentenyl-diphosphate Delta-isomerase